VLFASRWPLQLVYKHAISTIMPGHRSSWRSRAPRRRLGKRSRLEPRRRDARTDRLSPEGLATGRALVIEPVVRKRGGARRTLRTGRDRAPRRSRRTCSRNRP
jgi:hypothetical protein